MKITNKLLPCILLACLAGTSMNAQFLKKLAKKAEDAAARTVEGRVDQEATKKTDKALDGVLEPGTNKKEPPNNGQAPKKEGSDGATEPASMDGPVSTGPKTLNVYSKFDFVPGEVPLFQDDFSQEFIGDLPSNWNTNGSGEVVQLENSRHKWYFISNKSITLPNLTTPLSGDYTIEFDLLVTNLSKETNSYATLEIQLTENPNLGNEGSYVLSELNFCQFIDAGVKVDNFFRGDPDPINNTVRRDFRQLYKDVVHVSVAVNGNRYRIWLNEHKVYDLPKFLVEPTKIKYLRFEVDGMDQEKNGERVLITNLRINQGGEDLRRKLISDGKVSTNGILFNTGSSDILPESMGIIRQVSQVLAQETSTKLKIVGHTDADGSEESNLQLSKARAEAVKNALSSVYGISKDRLETEGKGESQPIGDDATALGKAQNRRVEFIKL